MPEADATYRAIRRERRARKAISDVLDMGTKAEDMPDHLMAEWAAACYEWVILWGIVDPNELYVEEETEGEPRAEGSEPGDSGGVGG